MPGAGPIKHVRMTDMELYEAIFKRRSTRQYAAEQLPEDVFARIESIAGKADRLYDTGLQIHVVRDGNVIHKTFKGIASNYVKVTAPHYLVVTSEDKPGWGENSGYVLEQVVLEMTQMGLATCWMGGPADRESLNDTLAVEKTRVVGVFLAFGKPATEGDQYRNDPKEAKRKTMSQIVTGQPDENWTRVLEAARMAPSAVNSQPWRFFVEAGRADLYIAKPNLIAQRMYGALNPVDAGIALRHVAIAAKHFGLPLKIEKMQSPGRKDHTYVTSMTIG
jgi:nitroreductase